MGSPEFDPWVGKNSLEKGKGTQSNILAWRIPWTKSVVSQSPTQLSDFHFHYTFTFVAQWCLTLCDLIALYSPGSSVHGIFQGRIVEWVAISFLGGSSRQEIEPCLLHWQAGSLPQSHLGNPQNKSHITN